LNGAGNTRTTGIEYAGEIITRFANNYCAHAHLFPVPTYFDYAETKAQLWKEGSIQHILEMQNMSDLLLYSIGAVNAGVPSYVHSAGYLDKKDYAELEKQKVVGDIATVFSGKMAHLTISRLMTAPVDPTSIFRKNTASVWFPVWLKIAGLHGALKWTNY